MGHHFTDILEAGWRGGFGRSWNSEIPLFFVHVVLTKMLVIRREKEIRARITRRMDLWERGIHAGLVRYTEAEGGAREGRAASGGEEEDEAVAISCHDTVLSCKIRQTIRCATYREVVGCLLPYDQYTKTGRPFTEVLR